MERLDMTPTLTPVHTELLEEFWSQDALHGMFFDDIYCCSWKVFLFLGQDLSLSLGVWPLLSIETKPIVERLLIIMTSCCFC